MHGKTFAMVSVAAVVLALVFSLALPIEAAISAHKPEKPEIVGETPGGGVPELQLGECLLCYTCGGFWPVPKFVINQSPDVATYENGAECGGSNPIPSWILDPQPSYCCNL